MRLAFVALCAFFIGFGAPVRAADRAPLIFVLIDGARPDYLERGITPTLSLLAKGGVLAEGMRPSFPSVSLPNHYTLVTGRYPDNHGVVDNWFIDTQHGRAFGSGDPASDRDPVWFAGATPLWVTAEQQGLRTASVQYFTEEVVRLGLKPRNVVGPGKLLPAEKVSRVLDWFDRTPDQRPQFVTLYFPEVDTEGHKGGPNSAGVNKALGAVDAALGDLVAGLDQRGIKANLVIVSDHGMTAAPMDRIIDLDSLLPVGSFRATSLGASAGVLPEPGQTDAVEAILLGEHDHYACWRKSELPARFHYGRNPRIAPIFCLAQPSWMLASRAVESQELQSLVAAMAHLGRTTVVGMHGYDPADRQMMALFVANGPAFRPGGRLGVFDNVDVYPLLSHLIAVKPEANDGDLRTFAAALEPAPEP